MKTETIYNIGIVGCGTISKIHAEAINSMKKGHLVAVHSRNQTKLDAFCDQYGGRGYTDYDKFLSDKELDAVVICTPSGTHLDYGLAAAKAKKHIIVEKPIEVSIERGLQLIEECKRNTVELAVIFQNRFIGDVIKMKKVVDSGSLGKIFMASASVNWFRDQAYYDSAAWRGTLELDGGGVLINQGIHTIDLLTWMAGDIESLYATMGTFTHEGIEGEDNIVASLKFRNGAIGTIEASTSMVPPQKRRVEINGSSGTALLEGDSFRHLITEKDLENKNSSEAAGGSSPLAGFAVNHHKKQYDEIFEAISNQKSPVVTGKESLRSLGVIQAIYASAKQQKLIVLDEFLAEHSLSSNQ
ncbi:MAG: Gfo/Idh/MocA family oxidoreductase [Balneolales bacterium]